MRKLALLCAFLFTLPAMATSYFISPSGSDSNNGLSSGAPWLTPNHAVNCGDTLTAASGTYLSTNFNNGDWGVVSNCSGGNQVAWIICGTFDACKINATSAGGNTAPGLWVDKSNWGVQGWEVTVGTGVTFGTCIEAGPSGSTSIHHIIFANNIANGCQNGGVITFNNGSTAGVDYIAIIGNIAYQAAQGSHSCTSGFSIYQPKNWDTAAGTHIYVAGNFAWANVDPNPCNGTAPTDGEPLIFDTFDSSQSGPGPYTQQAVGQNNVGFFNGGRGFEVFENTAGVTNAPVFMRYNTSYGNMTDNNQTAGCLGRAELALGTVQNTTYDHNLAQTRTGTSCMSAALYGVTVETGDGTDSVTNNWFYSAAGNNSLIDNSPGFSLVGNVSGTNPSFANPVNPGAPSCGSFASVPACMATVIADYTPTAGGSTAYGRQTVSNTSITDALFPQWLCTGTGQMNANIPANLITPGCGVVSTGGCAVSSGASVGTIQTAINSAASGGCSAPATHTVNLAAGSYAISSQLSIPCPNAAMVIQGPAPPGVGTTWPITPTAILTSSVSGGNYAFSGTACANGTTIQYLQYNGNQPSGGGGGFLFVPPGMNNVTLLWNWFYGVSALQNVISQLDTLVMFGNGNFSGAHIQNALVQYNRFGNFGTNGCGGQASSGNQGLMNLYGGNNACSGSGFAPPSGSTECMYQDNIDITHGGGSCGGVGIDNTVDGFTLINNSFTDLEQPTKLYEAPGTSIWPHTNIVIRANDLAGTHRIGSEFQSARRPSGPNYLWDSNSFHDPIKPNSGQWGLSLPADTTDSTNNVLIGNVGTSNDKNGQGAFYAGCGIEFWGTGTSSQNLIQGNWCAGIQWGFSSGGWSANNNIVQVPAHPGQCIVSEGLQSTTVPSQTGNVCSSSLSALTSVTPAISPTPTGTYSSPIAVTITDNGITSGAGPRGNTSIFYTLDGSTPTTASTWCASPCSLPNVAPGTTVNAIGMWGALNQPRSYPAGYGFVPSAVVGAHYSAGATPTLTGVSFSLAGGVTSIQVATSVQSCATATYSGGVPSVLTCGNGPDTYGTTFGTWTSSVPADASISTSGLVLGVAAGSTNLAVKASQGATNFTASPFTLAITAPPPPSPYLGNPNFDTPGQTSPSVINSVYAVTGTTPAGYNVQSGSFYLPTGTYAAGSKWDVGLIPATSPTAQATSWLCHATYTNTGTSSDVGWHTISLPLCGVLPASTAYWVGVITSNPGRPNEGFSTCGGSPCTGPPPTVGNGTYPCAYISATYGVYTGMGTAMNSGCGAPGLQASQYVTLGTPLPTLNSAFLANPGPTRVLSLGGAVQFSVFCGYDDGTFFLCFPTPDKYGNTATAFSSNNTAAVTIGNIGSAHPGLATSVAAGTAGIAATVTGGVTTIPLWNLTVSTTVLPYPPSSPRVLSR